MENWISVGEHGRIQVIKPFKVSFKGSLGFEGLGVVCFGWHRAWNSHFLELIGDLGEFFEFNFVFFGE